MNNVKKRVVTSYNNLAPELQVELKKLYPLGFTDSMLRIEKPGGDFFYAVVMETAEINYLVKIDVKIDGTVPEEEDKELYDDDGELKDDDIAAAEADIADED